MLERWVRMSWRLSTCWLRANVTTCAEKWDTLFLSCKKHVVCCMIFQYFSFCTSWFLFKLFHVVHVSVRNNQGHEIRGSVLGTEVPQWSLGQNGMPCGVEVPACVWKHEFLLSVICEILSVWCISGMCHCKHHGSLMFAADAAFRGGDTSSTPSEYP